MTKQFSYNLNYDKTEWGSFYLEYKTCNQGQLQKFLLKIENERKKNMKIYKSKNPYDLIKVVQHLFYCSEYDNKLEQYITPKILLQSVDNGNSDKWLRDKILIQMVTKNVYIEYWKRQTEEKLEVLEFYNTRKSELELEQKIQHNAHAKELVSCSCCKSLVARTNYARHLKTNKKCLTIKMANGEL